MRPKLRPPAGRLALSRAARIEARSPWQSSWESYLSLVLNDPAHGRWTGQATRIWSGMITLMRLRGYRVIFNGHTGVASALRFGTQGSLSSSQRAGGRA